MKTNSLRFLEAFRLEEVPTTKRKVFPEEKKWPKALRNLTRQIQIPFIQNFKLVGKNK